MRKLPAVVSIAAIFAIAASAIASERKTPHKRAKTPRVVTPADVKRSSFEIDPRRKRALEARRKKFLVGEIARLEKLVEGTRKKSPDRAQLIRRLAEGYAELAAIARREQIQHEIEAAEAKRALDGKRPRQHRAEKKRRKTKKRVKTRSVYPTRM